VTAPDRDPYRLVGLGVVLFFGGLLLLWTMFLARHVLLILYISIVLAIGFSPAVRWLERRRFAGGRRWRLPRWAAILVLYMAMVALVIGCAAIVLPPILAQATDLWLNMPGYVDRLQRTLVRWRLITHRYTWSEVLKNSPAPVTAMAGVLSAIGALQGVLGAVGAIVTTIVLPYYMLLEAESLQLGFLKLFAKDRRPQIARITRDVTVKVSAWLGGQILLSVVIGVTAAIGLWIIGVPYFYVLALVCAFGELIPIVGPLLAAIPAVLVAATVSLETAALTAAYFGVQQFIENHFLVPRVMQRQVGVSAVTVIVALLAGTELLGIVGALLAVPTAAIAQVLVEDYLERDSA
jgi:predicted PurR-regulated permease PerM